jgi:hypothetical protein
MFAPRFHPRRRDGPKSGVQTDFIPPRTAHLTGASRCQDCEFQRQGAHARLAAQRRHERRHLAPVQCRVMFDSAHLRLGGQHQLEVAAPDRGVGAVEREPRRRERTVA